MNEEFYLSLPSHSNLHEFPSNRSNNFKIRLPKPIHLDGSGWQVGLSAISLPDVNIDLSRYKKVTESLLRVKWFQLQDRKKGDAGLVPATTMEVYFHEIYQYGKIRNGIDFFKALIFKFEQKKRETLPCNWNTLTLGDKRLDPIFRWEGEDLILDDSLLDLNVIRNKVTPFETSFEKHVGVDFG